MVSARSGEDVPHHAPSLDVEVALVGRRTAHYGPAMGAVIALLAFAVVLVVTASLLPGNGAIDYPLLLLGATAASVVAVVRGVRLLRARRRRAEVVPA